MFTTPCTKPTMQLFKLQFKIMVFITMIMMHQRRCISVALRLLSARVQLEAYYLPRKRTRLHHYSRFQKDKHERATKYKPLQKNILQNIRAKYISVTKSVFFLSPFYFFLYHKTRQHLDTPLLHPLFFLGCTTTSAQRGAEVHILLLIIDWKVKKKLLCFSFLVWTLTMRLRAHILSSIADWKE